MFGIVYWVFGLVFVSEMQTSKFVGKFNGGKGGDNLERMSSLMVIICDK